MMWKWRRRTNEDFAEEIQAHISQETTRLAEEHGMSVKDAGEHAVARSST